MAHLNWRPVTESLFRHLEAAGITILEVNNGEEWLNTESIFDAIEYADGVDEAWVRVRLDVEHAATLYLCYGNDPHELVADYALIQSSSDDWIEAPLRRFAGEWEGVPCPTVSDDTSSGDTHTLDAVAALLSGREWEASDMDAIAELVRATGRVINDVTNEDDVVQ